MTNMSKLVKNAVFDGKNWISIFWFPYFLIWPCISSFHLFVWPEQHETCCNLAAARLGIWLFPTAEKQFMSRWRPIHTGHPLVFARIEWTNWQWQYVHSIRDEFQFLSGVDIPWWNGMGIWTLQNTELVFAGPVGPGSSPGEDAPGAGGVECTARENHRRTERWEQGTLPLPEFKPVCCIYSTISEFALRSFYFGVWIFCVSCIKLIRIPQG